MTKREQLIDWLGDAHAMEVGIVTTLDKHIKEAKGQPQVVAALKKHLSETKKHATATKQALSSLGGSRPVIREGISKALNLVAGIGTLAAKDTSVKNAIADFATEHFEIACYLSLIQTATILGEKKIAQTCRGILREEEAMARTLKALFPQINATYLETLADDEKTETVSIRPTTRMHSKRDTSVNRSAKKTGTTKSPNKSSRPRAALRN